METSPGRVLFLSVILCLAGATVAIALVSPALAGDDADLVEACAVTPPEDHAAPAEGNETIGWFDGYWYDEPLNIDASDGITEDELEALSARTAARFEAMRCLAFEELPPVEIIDRETFAEQNEAQYAAVDDRTRLYDNAQFEALLLIGSDEDAVDVRQEDRSATVGGYYNFQEGEIVVVSDDPDTLLIDEAILAHELGHALQDQHFDLAGYQRDTQDLDNGKLGVIEGDVHRIEHRYLEYCAEDRWSEPCITEGDPTAEEPQDDAGEPPSWGLYFMQFQPYSDGPAFVDHVYESGGWDAVDALYDEMPTSSLHTISPETYGEVDPEALTVDDESSDDWERLNAGGPDHQVIGQAGLSAILMDPAYDGNPIVNPEAFLNTDETGELDPTNPLNYDLEETAGWRGDRLYVYHDEEDRTASVWKLAWTDAEEAERFAGAYEDLIDHRGGTAVDAANRTYEFGEDSAFDTAVTIAQDGDRLWIVTAPSVDELEAVHGTEALEESAADNAADDAVDDADDAADETPGFGAVTALVATLAVAVAVVRRLNG
ncbi:Hvo_1808 family surface protein [Natrononativus amylolyticus]|uniref:Hvo_1808 family surface protein n=1 Tax=Natrononativus amylolyticus TaxID=2963434 RepID=UPI0020CFD991|nr:Hvo_1808 family surface protein [Natrononativus amylolyticus]